MAATDRRSRTGGRNAWRLGVAAALMMLAPPAWSQSSAPPLDALHSALHLSRQQDGAWQAYRAQAAAPSAAQDRRQAASAMFPNLSAPQRMDLVAAEMKQELIDLEQQTRALKAFYATLSAEQKAIFDAQTLPPRDPQQPPAQ